jgi:Helicase associated domain
MRPPPSHSNQWNRRFAELERWKSVHGDCRVKKAQGPLGRWVARQRELFKVGKLEYVREVILMSMSNQLYTLRILT